MAQSSSESPTKRKTFLDLPAELRNEIYSLSLLEPEYITIDKNNYRQPALLQATHQVRSEAAQMYYSLNRFIFSCTDFNATAYITFRQHSRHFVSVDYLTCDSCRQAQRYLFTLSEGPERAKSWTNLLRWAKASHEDEEILGLALKNHRRGTMSPRIVMAARVFDISQRFADLPWERVRPVLMHCREIQRGQQAITVERNTADDYDLDDLFVDFVFGVARWVRRKLGL